MIHFKHMVSDSFQNGTNIVPSFGLMIDIKQLILPIFLGTLTIFWGLLKYYIFMAFHFQNQPKVYNLILSTLHFIYGEINYINWQIAM